MVDEGDLDKVQEELVRPITIRDLLRHTSGLTYSEDVVGREEVAKLYAELGVFPLDEPEESGLPTLSDHITALAQLPLVAQPGQQFIYSVSIDVLRRILEIVERKSLDLVLREWILDPLGMDSTYFVVPLTRRRDSRRCIVRDLRLTLFQASTSATSPTMLEVVG